jgi:hypothetical protein
MATSLEVHHRYRHPVLVLFGGMQSDAIARLRQILADEPHAGEIIVHLDDLCVFETPSARNVLDATPEAIEVALQHSIECLILSPGAVIGEVQGLLEERVQIGLSIAAVATRTRPQQKPTSSHVPMRFIALPLSDSPRSLQPSGRAACGDRAPDFRYVISG